MKQKDQFIQEQKKSTTETSKKNVLSDTWGGKAQF